MLKTIVSIGVNIYGVFFLSLGKYHTHVERSKGAAGLGAHSAIYGITNWDHVNSTLAMFVVWNGGESITGWVGE